MSPRVRCGVVDCHRVLGGCLTRATPAVLRCHKVGATFRPLAAWEKAGQTGTNADLIAAVAGLYLTGSVLDVTYGEGKWWERFTPEPFTYHDLHKVDGVDFTALPEATRSVDAVCFDPPYIHSGGAASNATTEDFRGRFGLEACSPRAAFYGLILDGLAEVCRVGRRFVLVKCMDFAQGEGTDGTGFHDVPTVVTAAARAHGWGVHDRIVHFSGSGPGGHNIFDVKRARRHHSYLVVFVPLASRLTPEPLPASLFPSSAP